MDDRFEKIWRFIRGDLKESIFEDYIYNDSSLNKYLGESLYLEVISNDYNDKNSTYNLKLKLKQYMNELKPLSCKCIQFKDLEVLTMNAESCELISTLIKVIDRGMPYWWLSLQKCNQCMEYWLLAQEERINDNFILKRLSKDIVEKVIDNKEWPDLFNDYADLLKIGNEESKCFTFVEPLKSPSIFYTIVDLAKCQPKISVSELSKLLNLNKLTTLKIAKRAIKEEKVKINLKK